MRKQNLTGLSLYMDRLINVLIMLEQDDKFMTHGDCARLIGFWHNRVFLPHLSKWIKLLNATAAFDQAINGDRSLRFDRLINKTTGEPGAGAYREITINTRTSS